MTGRAAGWLLAACAIAGCGESPPPVEPPPSTPVAASPAEPSPTEPADAPSEPPSAESDRAVVAESAESAPDRTTEQPPDPPSAPARRLVVFTPSGPLLLDLSVTVDGAPLEASINAFGERLIAAADGDGDGVAAWSELIDGRAFLAGPFGGGDRTGRSDRQRWRALYDDDGDGRVDRREALTWFDRDANAGRLGMALLGGRAYTPGLVASATWRTLDSDADGRLSEAEVAAATDALLRRDTNDDRVIVPAELLSLADLTRLRLEARPMTGGGMRSYGASFRSALFLDRDADARDARSALASFDSGGRGAVYDPASLGFAAALAAHVDVDGDGHIAKAEWENLRTATAHAGLEVAYGAETPGPSRTLVARQAEARLRVSESAVDPTRAEIVVAPSADGADSGGVLLLAIVDEAPGGYDEQALRGLFQARDANADERLSREEFEAEGEPNGSAAAAGLPAVGFDAYDTDGDGAVSYDEAADYVVAAGARQRLCVSVVVNDSADPHFATLDGDGDGRLGEREILAAGETLRGAGPGSAARRRGDIPWRMRLTVFRTARQLTPDAAPPTLARGDSAESAPPWFIGADVNRDGEVSRREFVGSPPSFTALDANADGFLTVDEAGPGGPVGP